MSRPPTCRKILGIPHSACFKPAGIPLSTLESIRLGLDEFEAIRLADLEGCYHEDAAVRMGVSRQTFGNIIQSARRKIADALVNGKALMVEGGNVTVVSREFVCTVCDRIWSIPFGEPRPEGCPLCGATTFHRLKPRPPDTPDASQKECGKKSGG